LEVFEQSLGEMRKMLESEIEEKNKYVAAVKHLSSLQKKYKLTWVPSDSQPACLLCKENFSMFGSKSKHYCRYCGRLYCKACTKEMSIPEFGFPEKVRVCTPCFNFKHGRRPFDTESETIDTVSYDDNKSTPASPIKNQTPQPRPSSSTSAPGKGTSTTPGGKGSSTPTSGKGKTNEPASTKNTKASGLGFLDDDDDVGPWGAPRGAKDDDDDEGVLGSSE